MARRDCMEAWEQAICGSEGEEEAEMTENLENV